MTHLQITEKPQEVVTANILAIFKDDLYYVLTDTDGETYNVTKDLLRPLCDEDNIEEAILKQLPAEFTMTLTGGTVQMIAFQ